MKQKLTSTQYNSQLGFFHGLSDFIQQIPSSSEQCLTSSLLTSSLLDSYLKHYQIDYRKTYHNSEQSDSYAIWQSQIQNYRIVLQRWLPQKPLGLLVICHGYFDHIALYGRLIQWGLDNGLVVFGFDLPGHGLSSGKPASIDSFDTYSSILDQIIEQAHKQFPKLPLLAVGQSTGCAIIANSLKHKPQLPIHHCALLAPLVRSYGWLHMRWMYFGLRPFVSSIKRHFKSSSHDKAFQHFIAHEDPLQTRHIPLDWLGAMESWYQTIESWRDNYCEIPLTLIQGTGDTTVDWQYNIESLQRCFPNYSLHWITNAQHHLVKESDEYWSQVEKHLPLPYN